MRSVRGVVPMPRVVYADDDPVVVSHERALLGDSLSTVVVTADLRQPWDLFARPTVRSLINLAEPVAILLVAVLHFVEEHENPWAAIRGVAAASTGSVTYVSRPRGRIHTPAATVAVLPLAEEADFVINEADLKMTPIAPPAGRRPARQQDQIGDPHHPSSTGVIVAMQEERSQHHDHQKAMALLRARASSTPRTRSSTPTGPRPGATGRLGRPVAANPDL